MGVFIKNKFGADIDMFVFLHQLEKALLRQLLDSLSFAYVDYGKVEPSKLLHFFPTAEIRQVNLGEISPLQRDTLLVRNVAIFDVLHTGPLKANDRNRCKSVGIEGKLASYRRFPSIFNVHDTPLTIEQYSNHSHHVVIDVNHHIDTVTMVNNNELYRVMSIQAIVDNIELRVGDRVKLHNQNQAKENGSYFVMNKHAEHVYLNTAFPIDSSKLSVVKSREMNSQGDMDTQIFELEKKSLPEFAYYEDDVFIFVHDKEQFGRVEIKPQQPGNRKQLVRAYVKDIKLITDHVTYMCTEPAFVQQYLCQSLKDINGENKQSGVWEKQKAIDEPCTTNEQCPYYKANKPYINSRGGCVNGYCEMPIGVERIGFRSYKKNTDSFPYCYGCTFDNMQVCCEEENPIKDYAFPFDLINRESY
jgi:hypothetical protein